MSSGEYRTGREGDEFTYRGHTLDELQELSLDEVAELLPARKRRSIERGLTEEQQKLLETARDAGEEETANDPIRTHLRNMVILPEFVGLTFAVHNGQAFERVQIEPEMIGHYLGEFQLTRTSVEHGQAGIGATRSSKFVPLK
jgi:small subunit ribosomal protein S19